MSKSEGSDSSGMSVIGLLGVVFVTLKLCEVIDWSWWWVTAPFWAVPALLFAIIAGLAVISGIIKSAEWAEDAFRERRNGR